MNVKFDQSVILITGASSGIGEQMARQLASRAKTLILVARRKDRLEALSEELRAQFPKLYVVPFARDITDPNELDNLFANYHAETNPIDILINNAGMGDICLFEKENWAKIDQMIQLNIRALTSMTHRFLTVTKPSRAPNERGGILMVGSIAGFQSLPGFGVYSATKFYVRGFAQALRAELALRGITVSLLCPGPVETEFGEVATPGDEDTIPAWTAISADACSREALRGFEKGKALIVPGTFAKFLYWIQKIIPEFLHRPIRVLIASRIRAHGV